MRAFGKLIRSEVRQTLRHPPIAMVAVGLPVVLAAVFGAIVNPGNSTDPIAYYFPAMGLSMGLGVLSFSLLPTALATYRERGILRRLRTTPVPPSRLLGAQLFVNLLLALAAIVLVVVIGIVAFRFPVPRSFPAFVVSVLLSTLALTSIGLFVAAVAPTQRVATGIGVAFYFVNLVLGGIFVPSQALPPALADAGGFTPLGAMLQSIQDTWGGHHVGVAPLIVLGGIVVVFGGLATRFFRWE